jgi:hypothetical protein
LRATVFRLGRKISPYSPPASALSNLDITNRNDPATTLVAKLIIQIAGDGERDPARLAKRAVEIVLGSS